MVGQGYDGASAMSGNLNGVQAHVRKAAPTAVYVHCSSHSLNLVLNSCCSVSEIRNMFGIVKETINFINDSIKRREILEHHLTEAGSTSLKLKTFCETRFIERHEALVLFQNNYAIIVSSLEEILQLPDRKTVDKARSLLHALTNSSLIVSLCCAKKSHVPYLTSLTGSTNCQQRFS